MLDSLVKLGDSFNGSVYNLPIDDLDTFFKENRRKFTKSGMNSFLKTIGIPASFFNSRPEILQSDILISQKSQLRGKPDLLLLERQDLIDFTCFKSKAGIEDPSVKLDLTESAGWKFVKEDITRGSRRYVYSPEELSKDTFIPTVFLTVPVLYSAPLKIDIGLYREVCTNGMLDKINNVGFSLNQDSISTDILAPMLSGVLNAIKSNLNSYQEFLNYMDIRSMSLETSRQYLTSLTKENLFPKTLLIWADRHIDLLQNFKEVPLESPKEIENMGDVMNLLTFYAHELPSLGSQEKAESRIFETMFNFALSGSALSKLPSINVAEHFKSPSKAEEI